MRENRKGPDYQFKARKVGHWPTSERVQRTGSMIAKIANLEEFTAGMRRAERQSVLLKGGRNERRPRPERVRSRTLVGRSPLNVVVGRYRDRGDR